MQSAASLAKSPAAAGRKKNGSAKNAEFHAGDFLAKAGLGKAIVEVRANSTIFSQGDPADAVFYLQKGKIKVAVVSKQGKEATVALLGRGDFLGEQSTKRCCANT